MGRFKVGAIIVLLILVGIQVYVLFHGASKRPGASPTSPPTTTPPRSGASPAASKTAHPPSASATANPTPAGQAYTLQAASRLTGTETSGSWTRLSPPTRLYSLEVPASWSAFATQQSNVLLAKAPAPSHLELVTIPFNYNESNTEKEIAAAENSFLARYQRLSDKKVLIGKIATYQRSYSVNAAGGNELAEVSWLLIPDTNLCIPIILKGPPAEVKAQAATYDHMVQSFSREAPPAGGAAPTATPPSSAPGSPGATHSTKAPAAAR